MPQAITSQLLEKEQLKVDPNELEMQRKMELLRTVRVQREASVLDRSKLSGLKPEKKYVWVNVREDRQVDYQSTGYVRCTDAAVKSPWKKADGTHVRGDLVLYEIGADVYEALTLDNSLRAVEVVENKERDFLEFAERRRFPAHKIERS